MAEAGLDRVSDYAFDVFRVFPDMTPKTQADFKALVPFATTVASGREARLEQLVLGHGAFPPSVGAEIGPAAAEDYTPWTTMLKRWGTEFLAYADGLASPEVARAVGLRGTGLRRLR